MADTASSLRSVRVDRILYAVNSCDFAFKLNVIVLILASRLEILSIPLAGHRQMPFSYLHARVRGRRGEMQLICVWIWI